MDTAAVRSVLEPAGVVVAYLFGSHGTSAARPDSDADIAVLTSAPLGLIASEVLADQVAQAVGVDRVDLVHLETAPLELRGHVVQTGRLLFSLDEVRRVRFETSTRSAYFDYAPTLERLTRSYLEHVAARGL